MEIAKLFKFKNFFRQNEIVDAKKNTVKSRQQLEAEQIKLVAKQSEINAINKILETDLFVDVLQIVSLKGLARGKSTEFAEYPSELLELLQNICKDK